MISNATEDLFLRWTHIIFRIPITGYILMSQDRRLE